MNCPSCGSDNRDGNLFCNKCGGKLEVVANTFEVEDAPSTPSVEPVTESVAIVEPSPFKPQSQYQAPQPQYQAPQPQYQASQPQYQPVATVPVVTTPAYIGVVPAKTKKRFCFLTMIATVLYIISFFLPFVSYRGIDGGSMYDALFGASRMYSFFGADPTGLFIILGALGLALLFGLIDSFCNTRALSILGSLIIIGFIVLIVASTGLGTHIFEIAGVGFYGFSISGLLMFIGGCSGV